MHCLFLDFFQKWRYIFSITFLGKKGPSLNKPLLEKAWKGQKTHQPQDTHETPIRFVAQELQDLERPLRIPENADSRQKQLGQPRYLKKPQGFGGFS